jgi:hypothetical protein
LASLVVALLSSARGSSTAGSSALGWGAGARPIFAFSSLSALSVPAPLDSRALNFCCQGVAAQLVAQIRVCLRLGLYLIHLLRHALEGVEGACVGKAAHGALNRLLCFGALLASNEDVFLAFGLLDLVVEGAQLILELVDGVLLELRLFAEFGELGFVFGFALERLARQGRRQRAPPAWPCVPIPGTSSPCSSRCFSRRFLVRDGDRDLFLGLDQLVAACRGRSG